MTDEYVSPLILDKFQRAKAHHDSWRGLWQDCYDHALPQRSSYGATTRRHERLFDATALDAVDQLASMILGYLTPPLSNWFGFRPGTDLNNDEAKAIMPSLEKTARLLQAHFDQSNFTVEVHQCFLDLIVAGTASLLCEEAEPGELSALRFQSIPLQDIILDENQNGKLDISYRLLKMSIASIPESIRTTASMKGDGDHVNVLSCIIPTDHQGRNLHILCLAESGIMIHQTTLNTSPYINFRWMKSPGDVYGRSPIMKALPDIKTANKVVELILKNASISVTGIWQAEDDGVLNVANIELVPGAIIPKAMGSKGLTPLEMPARFDVSQLVLSDLRARIRHALMVDRLPQLDTMGKLTATEIMTRSDEMSLLLGATFGRLQVEFLNPLIQRAYSILRKRGSIPDLPLDGRTIAIEYRSPLAKSQSSRDAQNLMNWLDLAERMGEGVADNIDRPAFMAHITNLLGVPEFLKKS